MAVEVQSDTVVSDMEGLMKQKCVTEFHHIKIFQYLNLSYRKEGVRLFSRVTEQGGMVSNLSVNLG